MTNSAEIPSIPKEFHMSHEKFVAMTMFDPGWTDNYNEGDCIMVYYNGSVRRYEIKLQKVAVQI